MRLNYDTFYQNFWQMTKWIQLLSNAFKFKNDYGVRESRRFGAASEKGSDFNWFFSLSLHTATLIVVAFKWVNSINLCVGMINQSIDFFKRHFLSEGNKIYIFSKSVKIMLYKVSCCEQRFDFRGKVTFLWNAQFVFEINWMFFCLTAFD